jgi:hypothetical protein
MTDVNLSEAGNAVLVATQPDHDNGTGAFALTLVDAKKGSVKWTHEMGGQVKAQDLSQDGSLIVISDYDDELIAYNASGKKLWTASAVCKPTILNAPRKILCFHDDDAEPDVVFDVFDFNGKKLESLAAKTDVLLMKVSEDQKHFVAAFAGGGISLFGTKTFKLIWHKKLGGEIVDIALSSGEEPSVSALYKPSGPKRGGQRIALIDFRSKTVSTVQPNWFTEQLEMPPSGDCVYAYGNGPKGQSLSCFSPPSLKEAWGRRDKRFADYSSQLLAAGDVAVVGFEDLAGESRHSHLLVFDREGGLQANIPLQTDEGAYVYAQGYSPQASLIAVGTDDGTLSGYRLSK